MPLLIRIILQRLLVFVFSILAFFGINPDLSVPSPSVVEEQKEVRQERVEEVLQIQRDVETQKSPEKKIVQEVETKITDIQKEFTKSVAEPLTETIKEIAPTNLVYESSQKTFDVKDVVVNILCLEKTSTYTRLSTGSGVIISSRGLILTNAHVTYPFLKGPQFDSNVYSCSVRRENIPNFGYNAELVYYPVDWLSENKDIIKNPSPVGTGENDYALLQITSPIGPTPKVDAFVFASTNIESGDLKEDLSVTVAGYPSVNSGVFEVDARPGLRIAETQIADFFTFSSRSYDVLQTGVNSVAHRGSSGGGIFKGNNLYGIVVTTNTNSEGSYINALTLPYIKKDFQIDTGKDFNTFINMSFESLKTEFNSKYKDRLKSVISES